MSLRNTLTVKCPHCPWHREAAFASALAAWLLTHCRQAHPHSQIVTLSKQALELVKDRSQETGDRSQNSAAGLLTPDSCLLNSPRSPRL